MSVPRIFPLGDLAEITQGLSRSGRGAGAQEGIWEVRLVTVGMIQDDRIELDRLDTIRIEQNVKTEKHLIAAYDVLVTARSSAFKAALVPATIERTVADATLNVLRAHDNEIRGLGSGLGPYLGPYIWWYLTSSIGREMALAVMTGVGIPALTVQNLARLPIAVPPARDLFRIADLIDASERAYVAGLEATQLRRNAIRDEIIRRLRNDAAHLGIWRRHDAADIN